MPVNEASTSLMACLPFYKPKTRSEPNRRQCAFDKISSCVLKKDDLSNVIWVMLRLLSRNILHLPAKLPENPDQVIPFWTGYNCSLSHSTDSYTSVAYAPVIDSKPSDMGTVFTCMKKSMDMSKAIGQQHSIQTFDQQLYAVAQQVKWSNPDLFKSHILRLGGCHALSCFIGSVGKLWGN